ncbi:MAG: hypothetical protein RIC55_04205 [Pirellulaceae bacterium]
MVPVVLTPRWALIRALSKLFLVAAINMAVAPTIVAEDARQDVGEETARLDADDARQFGESPTRIDFEADPSGKELMVGEDIGRRFVDRGVLLSSSVDGAIVSVETYNVGGRSGGRCAATHDPLYQGTLTLRFCTPGDAEKPAGVHAVGFWISHIAPDGASLLAFDKDGKELGVVKTNRHQRQFLGIHSRLPIARVDVVPDPEIDPDYAIDDLTFDRPTAISR